MQDQHLSAFQRRLVRWGLLLKPAVVSCGFVALMLLWLLIQFPGPLLYTATFLLGNFLILTGFNYIALTSTFLDDCVPKPIPQRQFASVLKSLEAESIKIQRFGFEEIDRFYIKRTHDFIYVLFKHQQENICLTLISLAGQSKWVVLSTKFESNLAILTTSSVSGHFPKPLTYYLQALGRIDYQTLLEAHRNALELFAAYGHYPVKMPRETLRSQCINLDRDIAAHIMSFPLWALRMSVWLIFKTGQKYNQILEEQLLKGIIKIPKASYNNSDDR